MIVRPEQEFLAQIKRWIGSDHDRLLFLGMVVEIVANDPAVLRIYSRVSQNHFASMSKAQNDRQGQKREEQIVSLAMLGYPVDSQGNTEGEGWVDDGEPVKRRRMSRQDVSGDKRDTEGNQNKPRLPLFTYCQYDEK